MKPGVFGPQPGEAGVIGFRVGCGVPPACEGILSERFLTRYRTAASHLADKVMLRIMGFFGGTPMTAAKMPTLPVNFGFADAFSHHFQSHPFSHAFFQSSGLLFSQQVTYSPVEVPVGIPVGTPVGIPVGTPVGVPVGIPVGVPVVEPVVVGFPEVPLVLPVDPLSAPPVVLPVVPPGGAKNGRGDAFGFGVGLAFGCALGSGFGVGGFGCGGCCWKPDGGGIRRSVPKSLPINSLSPFVISFSCLLIA